MELVNVFKLSLYGLTALAAWILGRAEGGFVPYITFPVLVIAFVVIESGHRRSLSAGWANLFGILAVVAAGYEFSLPGPESKLLAGAHLLIYATWIVMFQEKSYRLYWWVMALGILQVAVASVLQPGPWYGLSLLTYVCAALMTMSVASLYQVQQQYATVDTGWKLQEVAEGSVNPVVVRATGRPDLASDPSVSRKGFFVRSSVRFDETHQWLTRRFFGGMFLLITLSLVVSAGFFTLTPRIWFGPRNIFGDEMLAAPSRRTATTGFAREVRLGEMGEILESVTPVFSIRCRDTLTEETVSLQNVAQRMGNDAPLFRGTVMTEYAKGRWFPERNDQPVKVGRVFNRPGIAQEVTLEPTTDEILFCVGSPEAVEILGPKEDAYLQLATGILARERPAEQRQRLSYTVYTTPPNAELTSMNAAPMPQGMLWRSIDPAYVRRNTFVDPELLPNVVKIAQQQKQTLEDKLQREPTMRELASDFENYLRDSGLFGYTLSLSIKDPTIDPIEDFLINRREGHCEYFASTMTLMLRAVGIPARLVSGFKGAEFNNLRGNWEVQERFAHAWVEAWNHEHQLWLTYDPTPSEARNRSVETVSSRLGFWGRLRATSTTVWQDYVVNVSLQQQQDRVYGPLRRFGDKVVSVVRRVTSSWQAFWSSTRDVIMNPSRWFSVTGGLVTFFLLATLTMLVQGTHWLLSWLKQSGWIIGWGSSDQPQLVVAFYGRFMKLMRQLGYERETSQTPQEFAIQIGRDFRQRNFAADLLDLPLQISTALYRVRFGREALETREIQELESRLSRLEAEIAQSAG